MSFTIKNQRYITPYDNGVIITEDVLKIILPPTEEFVDKFVWFYNDEKIFEYNRYSKFWSIGKNLSPILANIFYIRDLANLYFWFTGQSFPNFDENQLFEHLLDKL